MSVLLIMSIFYLCDLRFINNLLPDALPGVAEVHLLLYVKLKALNYGNECFNKCHLSEVGAQMHYDGEKCIT